MSDVLSPSALEAGSGVPRNPVPHATAAEFRYQVYRVRIAAGIGQQTKLSVSGAVFLGIVGTSVVAGATPQIRITRTGDWLMVQVGDKIKCSPIEAVEFRNQNAAAVDLMLLCSNDPLFDFHSDTAFGADKGVWATST